MGAWQNAIADFDRTNGAGVATIDTWFAGQDTATNDTGFQIKQDVADGVGINCYTSRIFAISELRFGIRVDVLQQLATNLLAGFAVSGFNTRLGKVGNHGDQGFVLSGRCPIPFWLTSRFNQAVDHLDNSLLLVMTKHHATQHDFFRQHLGFGFNHQHGSFGTRNDQVHLRCFNLRCGWVQNVLTIDVTNAGCTNWAIERNARQRKRSRCTDQGRNIRINFRVDRHNCRNDLNFVEVTFREQRTQRTVDQTRGQRFFFRRTAFALEEATRDLAGGIGFFDVINSQREKVLAWLSLLGTNNGNQNNGVIISDHNRTAGLTGYIASFQGQGVCTVLNTFTCNFKHTHISLPLNNNTTLTTAIKNGRSRLRTPVEIKRSARNYLRRPRRSISVR